VEGEHIYRCIAQDNIGTSDNKNIKCANPNLGLLDKKYEVILKISLPFYANIDLRLYVCGTHDKYEATNNSIWLIIIRRNWQQPYPRRTFLRSGS
jgi:hypothetical protein